jgi:hypothetical protein
MMIPKLTATQEDIEYALNPTPWDLGNQVLYDLCSTYPGHSHDDAIIAKVWLIGRSYAAALERRKNKNHDADDFYETVVPAAIKSSNLDQIISTLPTKPADPIEAVVPAIKAHKAVMDIFQRLTGLDKRSLASKYLHFHRPDIFFIYDSRAQMAIGLLTPDTRYMETMNVSEAEGDAIYKSFCARACWLRSSIEVRFGVKMGTREIDKLLLNVYKRNNSLQQP